MSKRSEKPPRDRERFGGGGEKGGKERRQTETGKVSSSHKLKLSPERKRPDNARVNYVQASDERRNYQKNAVISQCLDCEIHVTMPLARLADRLVRNGFPGRNRTSCIRIYFE